MTAPIYVAILQIEAVAASTGYVLVDLSDTTNYPHDNTTAIEVLGIQASVETHGDGIFDLWIGCISEVDADNGSADWFEVLHCQNRDNASDDSGHYDFVRDYTLGGVNPKGIYTLMVSETHPHYITNITQDGNSTWQTDTGLASPAGAAAGATGKPGAGDIVMWAEEVTNGGTLDFCIKVFYRAV